MPFNRETTGNQQPFYKYVLANLRLREGKSTDAKVITVIPPGSRVEILDEDDEWDKVRYDSQEGYVYRFYLSTSKYPWSNLNLREGDTPLAQTITIIPKGARVEVIDNLGDWSRVNYNGQLGYVFNYFLSDDGIQPGSLDYSNFYSNMNSFVNENAVKSPTDYLLTTDLRNKLTYVFKRNNGIWQQLYKWECTVGKPKTPTITGIFFINGRKPSFGTSAYLVKYATRIRGPYYYHSILYNSTGEYVIDGRLGMALSHGCIRLATENAKWIYDNIPNATTVVIQ
ncbi:L,D-transpeptidase family protein [Clostridium polynesiense]|uniref:L,D-transpeptidase family protein n=1 Tax=Clostridium polynesiense TaxID=1325933 RepID=UPI0009E1F64B|nr:SH3 domain-containing protein [Clostridium polynesiense]